MTNLEGTMSASFQWVQFERSGLGTQSDDGDVTYRVQFDTSGVYGTNKLFHDTDTLPANTTLSLNLASLVKEVLDGQYTIGMSGVKGLLVTNESTNPTLELQVRYDNVQSSGTSYHRVGATGFSGFSFPISGVNPGTLLIRNAHPSSGVSYGLALLGTG